MNTLDIAHLAGFLDHRDFLRFRMGPDKYKSGKPKVKYSVLGIIRGCPPSATLLIKSLYGGTTYTDGSLHLGSETLYGLLQDIAPYCIINRKKIALIQEVLRLKAIPCQTSRRGIYEELFLEYQALNDQKIDDLVEMKSNIRLAYLAGAAEQAASLSICPLKSNDYKSFNASIIFRSRSLQAARWTKELVAGEANIRCRKNTYYVDIRHAAKPIFIHTLYDGFKFRRQEFILFLKAFYTLTRSHKSKLKHRQIAVEAFKAYDNSEIIEWKRCTKCQQYKSKKEFSHSHECPLCIRQRSREYYTAHREQMISATLKCQKAKKCQMSPVSRLRGNLCKRTKRVLGKNDRSHSLLIGCAAKELRDHLEAQFKPDMTWDNYGTLWHIDHVLPCAFFNLRDQKERRRCFHFTNLSPEYANDNIKKGDFLPNGMRARDIGKLVRDSF